MIHRKFETQENRSLLRKIPIGTMIVIKREKAEIYGNHNYFYFCIIEL